MWSSSKIYHVVYASREITRQNALEQITFHGLSAGIAEPGAVFPGPGGTEKVVPRSGNAAVFLPKGQTAGIIRKKHAAPV